MQSPMPAPPQGCIAAVAADARTADAGHPVPQEQLRPLAAALLHSYHLDSSDVTPGPETQLVMPVAGEATPDEAGVEEAGRETVLVLLVSDRMPDLRHLAPASFRKAPETGAANIVTQLLLLLLLA